MTEKDNNTGRDAKGRFTVGNPGGPGGPRRRAAELRRAAQEAVQPDHVHALMRKALRLGLEGNLSAARFVMDQAAGRVPEAPPDHDPAPVDLPPLRTASECNLAIDQLIAGIVNRTLVRDEAKLLLDAVTARIRAIETSEIEERLAELEKAADSVQHNGARRNPSLGRR